MMISRRDDSQREILMRFFRTAPGQYGAGDEFLGIKVPVIREIVKQFRHEISLDGISRLLHSKWHEIRLAALLLLVDEVKATLPRKKDSEEISHAKSDRLRKLAEFYLSNARQANNWDLVDLSCQYILGPYIFQTSEYSILEHLAESDNLWERRIAVVTTLYFIRNGVLEPSLDICDMLINDSHDLIHKAMGWILREVGKKDKDVLESYLHTRLKVMPRTTLRYAIERFTPSKRSECLRR